MPLTIRPVNAVQAARDHHSASRLPSQPRFASVEDDEEETTESNPPHHAPYDPSYAPGPKAAPQISKDFGVRDPQPQRPDYQSGYPSASGGWGPGNHMYRYPIENRDTGGAAYLEQAKWGGWAGSPHAYNYQSQPAQGPSGQYGGRTPAEIVPIDRDPERLVPYTDLWHTEKLEGELSTWLQPRSCLTENTQCELLTIRILEHGPDETGHVGTTLVCDNGPPRWNTDVEPQIRWLHAQRPTLSFACLERLVSTCPFVRFDLMKVTLRLLRHLSENVSSIQEGRLRLEPGTGLCYVGQYTEPVDASESQRTDPVMFLACPSLDITKADGVSSYGHNTTDVGPQSLLNTLYGYDVGTEREKRQIVRKMATDQSDKATLQVRQTWILRIGNNVLVTISNHGSEAMLGQSLRVGDGKSKIEGKISVRLQSPNGHRYNIAFDRSCRFADFHKKAVSEVMGSSEQPEKFRVLDPERKVLNETSWPQFVSSSRANAPTLILVLRATDERYSSMLLALPAPEVSKAPAPLVGRALTIRRRGHVATADNVKIPADSEVSYDDAYDEGIGDTSSENYTEILRDARKYVLRRTSRPKDDVSQPTPTVEFVAVSVTSTEYGEGAERANLECPQSNGTIFMTVNQRDRPIMSSTEVSDWVNNAAQNPPPQMPDSYQVANSEDDSDAEPYFRRSLEDHNEDRNVSVPVSPSEYDYWPSTGTSDALSDQSPDPYPPVESGGRTQREPFATSSKTRAPRGSTPALSTSEPDPIVFNAVPAHVRFSEPNGRLSTKIFSAFIPKSNTSGTHEIYNLYWGAVDRIFRQIQWRRAFYVQSETGAQFATHIAGRGHAATVSSVRAVSNDACGACQLDTPYASDQRALEHLHVAHGSCGANAERPHDDPCFAWLHQVTIGGEESASSDLTNKAMDMIEDFHGYLSQLSESISELQTLASRAGKKLLSGQGSPQLLLPPSLTRAFQHILEMYILRSHALSLKNKTMSLSKTKGSLSNGGSDARRISELLRWEKMAFDNTKEHINTARQKIFLADDSSNNMAVLGIEQVGIEFLTCALIGNIQSQSPAVPLPSQTQHTRGSCLELYQAYIAKLRFQCYQRPQRKVFLEIYSFEEELMALRALLKAQRKLLECFNYLRWFTFSDTYILYSSPRYAIESEQWRRLVEYVDRQESESQMLQDKCSGLKEQVKQAIEVIEENHGKAIRVFTIVTLFFLPLSLVSTFLGMNTTDVDGLKWDQSIFWATSLPITAVVLTLAILYGYKGDDISDWFPSKNSGQHWWPREQGPVRGRERVAKPTQERRFSGIFRRPTTDSLGIDS